MYKLLPDVADGKFTEECVRETDTVGFMMITEG